MNILDEIVSKKRKRVDEVKSQVSIEDIQNQLAKIPFLKSNFKKNLENQKQSIIAEIKRHPQVLELLLKILIQF